MDKHFKIIEKSRLFSGIDELELKSMLKCLNAISRSYKKGEHIFRSGDKLTLVGLVLSGFVIITKEDYWGNRTILSEISEGGIFGEAFACADNGTISVNASAAKDCVILLIDVGRVLTVCHSACTFHARLIRNLVTVLANKNVALSEKIEHMSQRKLRDKILSYLSECSRNEGGPAFAIPFNRQELADYLSADRSALSNELCRLRDEGIIEFQKNRFLLL